MKKLLLIFLLLFSVGCTVSKTKSKTKDKLEISEQTKISENTTVKSSTDVKNAVSDSSGSKSNYNIDRNHSSALQNFSLKNNGKCSDPGPTRYVQFTDALGNRSTIPVNDNTDLNFENITELKKEVESLQQENANLVKSNKTFKNQVDVSEKKISDQNKLIKSLSMKSDIHKDKNPFSLYALIIVCTVVVWELLKKLIKKYLLKR